MIAAGWPRNKRRLLRGEIAYTCNNVALQDRDDVDPLTRSFLAVPLTVAAGRLMYKEGQP